MLYQTMIEIGRGDKLHQWGEFILIYPDGIEVVKNTSPKYDIYIKHGQFNNYEHFMAKNPEQYDPAGFEDDDDDDSYIA
ncbi:MULTISPECIES: hypothetical protein [Psychrobacter]|uniref:hypothetical protein n=1 Tax=Psychrobacter TaxID=497 RepID=UPI0012FF0E51|nr:MULTISPECIES: hypothetical protein [Psychrobacter]NRD71546.1 hypothetical protein [Psychrobacter okhotskensis]